MVSRRELRGFRIIRGIKTRGASLKLLAINGSRFIVMLTSYTLGIPWRTRKYEFDRLQQAEFFYEKLAYTKMKYRFPLP